MRAGQSDCQLRSVDCAVGNDVFEAYRTVSLLSWGPLGEQIFASSKREAVNERE